MWQNHQHYEIQVQIKVTSFHVRSAIYKTPLCLLNRKGKFLLQSRFLHFNIDKVSKLILVSKSRLNFAWCFSNFHHNYQSSYLMRFDVMIRFRSCAKLLLCFRRSMPPSAGKKLFSWSFNSNIGSLLRAPIEEDPHRKLRSQLESSLRLPWFSHFFQDVYTDALTTIVLYLQRYALLTYDIWFMTWVLTSQRWSLFLKHCVIS